MFWISTFIISTLPLSFTLNEVYIFLREWKDSSSWLANAMSFSNIYFHGRENSDRICSYQSIFFSIPLVSQKERWWLVCVSFLRVGGGSIFINLLLWMWFDVGVDVCEWFE
jgi:hypothetical protein